VMRQGLRGMTSQDIGCVLRMHAHAGLFASAAQRYLGDPAYLGAPANVGGTAARGGGPGAQPLSRSALGQLIRTAGAHWRSCLQLALVNALPALPAEPSQEQLEDWRASEECVRVVAAFAHLTNAVYEQQLQVGAGAAGGSVAPYLRRRSAAALAPRCPTLRHSHPAHTRLSAPCAALHPWPPRCPAPVAPAPPLCAGHLGADAPDRRQRADGAGGAQGPGRRPLPPRPRRLAA
jgi:hypothetical protein